MKNYTVKRANGEIIKLDYAEALQIFYEVEHDINMQEVSWALGDSLENYCNKEVKLDDKTKEIISAYIMNRIGDQITEDYEDYRDSLSEYIYENIQVSLNKYESQISELINKFEKENKK